MTSFKNTLLLASAFAAAVSGAPVEQASAVSTKRGLAYNQVTALNPFAKKPCFSWSYNWGSAAGGDIQGTEYVPMNWGEKMFGEWDNLAEAALASGSKHLLAFNEPDLAEQANMSPEAAAAAYQQYMNPYGDRARLGSPAITNGAAPYGLDWMKKFFDACAGNCKIDFLAIHWYDGAEHAFWFKKHITECIEFAKAHGIDKIWVTEFQGMGDDVSQVKFMNEVLPWLDSNDSVERYAYFMVDTLLRGKSVSSVGQRYSS
ncbi:hypothetical protein AJ80_06489 [Polytolypa hystricis UAMH7299]|uniref:Asl1-like glycosyl hydrolase catalytic domain-containing protein n=1 Tax=Polytolypa hystricis (strain UAMH7299) TaxID=1447883 RepID=A0A2B7XVM5_POLH7|nr:hypothetical protein AJ80_06489 [Polytolypa hystricis UAMH7299]